MNVIAPEGGIILTDSETSDATFIVILVANFKLFCLLKIMWEMCVHRAERLHVHVLIVYLRHASLFRWIRKGSNSNRVNSTAMCYHSKNLLIQLVIAQGPTFSTQWFIIQINSSHCPCLENMSTWQLYRQLWCTFTFSRCNCDETFTWLRFKSIFFCYLQFDLFLQFHFLGHKLVCIWCQVLQITNWHLPCNRVINYWHFLSG